MNILGIVPARGGSKTIPRKNIKPLAGKPLIAYTLQEATKSKYITRLVVTTDDPEIAEVSKRYGAEVPFIRPGPLAEDHVTDLPVFQHCLNWLREKEGYAPEIVVQLRPTAPLRKAEHIDRGIELLLESPDADCVRSVCPSGQHPLKMWRVDDGWLTPFVPEDVIGIAEAYNMPRQELPTAYIQNGSVDVVRTEVILDRDSMTGSFMLAMVMPEEASVNIDNQLDWELAEILLTREAATADIPVPAQTSGVER